MHHTKLFRLRPSAIATILIAACAISAGASTPKHSKAKAKTSHKATATKAAAQQRNASADAGPLYTNREDVMQAADAIAQRRGLDATWVRATIGQARYNASIARAITPPPVGVPKNWALYRSRFVEPVRIKAGVKFWMANATTLHRAEEETGVPAEIIVGVIGVETIFGQQTGNYRVIDALSTLAFDFPQVHPRAAERSAFFLQELEAYLALTQRTRTDPLALRGSYAGAMGWPQFMPSSWDQYAVDFDGDGRIDLFNSQADVIGSVANYFKRFHWKPGQATRFAVQVDTSRWDKAALLAPDIVPSFSAADMAAKGVSLEPAAQAHPGLLALVELQNGDAAPQYVAGTDNFYAITRYNWSAYYAMAVIELGQAIAQAVQQVPPTTVSP
jgi:membrane-bound lytic murein transglycosylase B